MSRTIPGADWSFNPPDLDAFAHDGNRWAGRYIYGPATSRKIITKSEAAKLRALGVAILPFMETTRGRALAGRDAGIADAHASVIALNAIGCGDPGVWISPALDQNFSTSQMAHYVAPYVDGFASVIGKGRTAPYGGGNQLAYLRAHGHIVHGVQSAATDWGPDQSWVTVRQEHNGVKAYGGVIDRGHASSLAGMWLPQAPAPRPTNDGEVNVAKLPTLANGASGQDVRNAQGLLCANGHPSVVIDGKYGPATAAAVEAFQRAKHITVDGVCGPVTWSHLLGV